MVSTDSEDIRRLQAKVSLTRWWQANHKTLAESTKPIISRTGICNPLEPLVQKKFDIFFTIKSPAGSFLWELVTLFASTWSTSSNLFCSYNLIQISTC